jgi:hypothetical protein
VLTATIERVGIVAAFAAATGLAFAVQGATFTVLRR